MKSITDILGGIQTLLDIDFNPHDVFEEYLTGDQRTFLATLRVIEDTLPPEAYYQRARTGRPAYYMLPFMRAFFGQSFFRIPTMDDLRKQLRANPNLRKICGFVSVPSLSTFSRRLTELAGDTAFSEALGKLVKEYLGERITGNILRDSTAITARETPCNKKSEVRPPETAKRKRGRPRKEEQLLDKTPTVLEQQVTMTFEQAVKMLSCECAWGCKKNSQGNVSYWKGYKLHLDVTDAGIPVSMLVSGANVHDSQAAIPLEMMTETRVTHLYSLMDSAYDAEPIRSFIAARERIPIIDRNPRRKDSRPPFCPATAQHYKARSTVERANAHLKDWLIPSQIHVKGIDKVSFILTCGVLCLAAIKILQYIVAPAILKSA